MAQSTIDLKQLQSRITKLKKSLESPTPTPSVGVAVIWYDRAIHEEGAGRAAMVTRVESAGKIAVTIFPPNGMLIHKVGVLHRTDPIHEKRGNAVSKNCGSWDYVSGYKIPPSDYDTDKTSIRKRIKSAEEAIANAKAIKAAEEGTDKTRTNVSTTAT